MSKWIDKGIEIAEWLSQTVRATTDRCYCTQYRLSLYIDNELNSAQRARIDHHLAECSSCRMSLAVLQTTHNILTSREAVKPPAYLSERLRQAIALEAEKQRPSVPVTKRHSIITPRLVYAGAAAAAVLAVATVVNLHDSHLPNTVNIVHSPISHPMASAVPIASITANNRGMMRHSVVALQKHEENVARAQDNETLPAADKVTVPIRSARPIDVADAESLEKESTVHPARMNTRHSSFEIASAMSSVPHHEVSAPQMMTDQTPQPVATPESAVRPSAPIGGDTDQQPAVQASVADDNSEDTPRISLVDEEMQSMAVAVNTQNEQPKLVHLAILQTKPANNSGGLVPIVGTNIR